MAGKVPNDLLASWFERSGWSKGELARLVNRRARQLGAVHVSTDTSRVRRWMEGEQPRDPIPRILSELFTERFGNVVTASDLGMRDSQPVVQTSAIDVPWAATKLIDSIGEFTRSDLTLSRRGLLGTAPTLVAGPALLDPLRQWAAPRLPSPVQASGRTGRLSNAEIGQLETTVRQFRAWDAECGGGLRRFAVVGQLREVSDLLRDSYPEPVTRRLLAVMAELALLAGWMSYDGGMQARAQRYFVMALHAAKEGGDTPLGANVLATMARQLVHLNRSSDALDLLSLAQYGSRGLTTLRTRAMVAALEARAYASLGQASACHRAADRAEELYGDRDSTRDPDWITYFVAAELQSETGHAYRDLAYREPRYAEVAENLLGQAVTLFTTQASGYVRSRALTLVGLSSARLLRGQPELAASAAQAALGLTEVVRSARLEERLRITVAAAVSRFPDVADVRALADRVRRTLPTTEG
jgi:hypothetical protein